MAPTFSKPKSVVWTHFKKKNNDLNDYECIYCATIYKPHATRFGKHLLKCTKIPKEIQKKLLKTISSNKTNNNLLHLRERSTNQNSDTDTVNDGNQSNSNLNLNDIDNGQNNSDFTKKFVVSSFYDTLRPGENEVLRQQLSHAIHVTGCPFSMVEHPLWISFFKNCRPALKLPSRKAVGGKYLDLNHSNTTTEVNTDIDEAQTLHLQCDGWTNTRKEPVINFIVNKPEPLFVKQFATEANRHTGNYLYDLIITILQQYGPEKFMVLIGDNAKNIQNAFEKVQKTFPHIIGLRCIDHTLNLLCKDILSNVEISTFLTTCNDVISHIKNSHILHALFNANEHKKRSLVVYCQTRWGTNEKSLSRLLENKFTLQSLAINPEAKDMNPNVKLCILSNDFWNNVESLQKLLKPIIKAIEVVEGDGMYMEKVFKEMKILKTKMLNVLNEYSACPLFMVSKATIEADISVRLSAIVHPIHLAAVLLDPSDKGESLSEDEEMTAMEFIHQIAEKQKLLQRNVEGETSNNSSNIVQELSDYLSKSGFWKHSFLWEKVKDITSLSWWRGLCRSTSLSKIASLILTAPVTSAATERSFKTCSDIHTKKRNRLLTEKAAKVAFVSHNWKLKYGKRRIRKGMKELKDNEPEGAYVKLGQLLHMQNRDLEAMEILNKALKVDISQTKDIKINQLARMESLINLAYIYIENEHLIHGLTIYVEAVATAPPYYKPQALFVYIGETLVKMKNYDDADKWYEYITGEQPIRAKEIISLKSFANCSRTMRKKWVKAMEMFNFKDPYLYLQYSQLLINDNQYRKAVDILKKIIQSRPSDHYLMLKAARICRLAGFLEEAEDFYRKLVSVNPDASSFNELAVILKLVGKTEEAMMAYKYSQQLKHSAQRSLFGRQRKCDMARNCDTNDTDDVSN